MHGEGGRWRDEEEGEKSGRGERTAGGGRKEVKVEKLKWPSGSRFPSSLVTLVSISLSSSPLSTKDEGENEGG